MHYSSIDLRLKFIVFRHQFDACQEIWCKICTRRKSTLNCITTATTTTTTNDWMQMAWAQIQMNSLNKLSAFSIQADSVRFVCEFVHALKIIDLVWNRPFDLDSYDLNSFICSSSLALSLSVTLFYGDDFHLLSYRVIDFRVCVCVCFEIRPLTKKNLTKITSLYNKITNPELHFNSVKSELRLCHI